MGIHTMSLQGSDQQSPLQLLTRQSSWYNLTLDELENQLGDVGKPLARMNLDEFLNNVLSAEALNGKGTSPLNNSSADSLQRQASISLARALSSKTVDEVWRDIQQGGKKRFGEEIKSGNEVTLGEMTLEDFLVKAGVFVEEASLRPAKGSRAADGIATQNFMKKMVVSPSPSVGSMSNTPVSGRKRGAFDSYERTEERRLKRKVKNRESAARSRARKQAYHNELVSKVSRLEEENSKLKKEKELERLLPREMPSEPKYQLRRTSSTSF